MKASTWLVIALAVVVMLGWASTGFAKGPNNSPCDAPKHLFVHGCR
jgi:hypothetical protein